MASGSLFSDDASTSVDGIWFVGRTTPIVYSQPSPDETYLILGYNLGSPYPNRAGAALNAEAENSVDSAALAAGSTIRYITELAIRNETAARAGDGQVRMQMSTASDTTRSEYSHPFDAAALARAQLAIQVRPWYTVYRIPLAELVRGDGNFDWLEPASLQIGADVWGTVSTATAIRTVIFDPDASAIDDASLLWDDGLGGSVSAPPDPAPFFPAPPAPAGDTVEMMWIDVVTNGVRYGPLRDILTWQQDEIWNEGSRFSFSAVEKDSAARIEGLSEIYAYGIVGGHVTVLGAGIVQDVAEKREQTQTTLTVSGVGFEHELLGRPGVDLEFTGASHGDVVSALAARLPDRWSLHADPEVLTTVLALQLSATSLLGAIRKCAEIFNTRLQFDFDRTIRMRTYYTPLSIVASSDRGLGAHIVDLTRVTSAKEIVTILSPFASDNTPRLADATDSAPEGFALDADAGTVTHSSAYDRYGAWHREHTFRFLVPDDEAAYSRAGTANILLALAVERLRQLGEPQDSYAIVLQEMRQLVRPFHQLTMKLRDPRVDDSFRVASVSTTFDQAAGLRQATTVTTRQSIRLVDDISILARRLEDLFETASLAARAATRVYPGVAETSFSENGGGGGTPVYFVANPGDDVRARFEIERPGSGAYEYGVDNGRRSGLDITAELDLSTHIQTQGTHSLAIDLSPTPVEASRVRVRVTVSP